jgi:hypothetical protein
MSHFGSSRAGTVRLHLGFWYGKEYAAVFSFFTNCSPVLCKQSSVVGEKAKHEKQLYGTMWNIKLVCNRRHMHTKLPREKQKGTRTRTDPAREARNSWRCVTVNYHVTSLLQPTDGQPDPHHWTRGLPGPYGTRETVSTRHSLQFNHLYFHFIAQEAYLSFIISWSVVKNWSQLARGEIRW